MPVEGVEQGEREGSDGIQLVTVGIRFAGLALGEDRVAGEVEQGIAIVHMPVDRPCAGAQAFRQRADGETSLAALVEDPDRLPYDGFACEGLAFRATPTGSLRTHGTILT